VLTGWHPWHALQVTKLHHDLEEAIHTNTQLLADSSACQVELKGKEDELAALRVEILKVIKVRAQGICASRCCLRSAVCLAHFCVSAHTWHAVLSRSPRLRCRHMH
jgi:hypothetical protein